LFSAGDPAPVIQSLNVLAAMRVHMRRANLGEAPDGAEAASVGFTPQAIEDLYRLLAIAKYEDRYVIPAAHVEGAPAFSHESLTTPVSHPGVVDARTSGGFEGLHK
jgi:nitrate reductase / nitrite oxidoreductase, beta subunit